VALAIIDNAQGLALAVTQVHLEPKDGALPGMQAVEKLVDGLAEYILIACFAGALFGIGQWVLGSRTNNYSQTDSGKAKVAIAAAGAFLVGALPAIINFFTTAGGGVK
jgi:hypothetical protein